MKKRKAIKKLRKMRNEMRCLKVSVMLLRDIAVARAGIGGLIQFDLEEEVRKSMQRDNDTV